jgi:dTDP-3-amino-3,4,6-trideoxy-alpha-D-glucose transaminase
VNVPFMDLASQGATLGGVVEAVLREGRFVGGPRVVEFERRFAAFCDPSAECVGVGSGTDAIELGLRALGVGPGDEVITVANTCVPTVAGIECAGATPVLVDALSETATIDPERLASALTPRTRAIVPVHLYGRCADMDAVNAFAREHGLRVLEDAAQAHGAELGGRRAGTLADAAAFSFYPTKNLGAVGDAGAVVTSDPDVAERVRLLRAYGERERYRSELAGRNSRLDTLQAAVLTEKLARLDGWNRRRRELAALYRRELEGADVRLFSDDNGSAHHLFVVRSARRDDLQRSLAGLGIGTLVHYPRAIHQHPAYARLGHAALAVSERLAAEVLSLPLHPDLSDETVRGVAAAVRRAA